MSAESSSCAFGGFILFFSIWGRKMKMHRCCKGWLLPLAALLLLLAQYSEAFPDNENGIKSAVFLSPEFELSPGSVADKYFSNIEFPRGHIAIKSFNAEVVDEAGNSIPLYETYLHHWVVVRYHHRKGGDGKNPDGDSIINNRSDNIVVGNSGICQKNALGQYFGLGSETRRTSTHVPDPFGIQVGNPAEIPDGFEEQWMLNVHAIDTRGAVDRLGCTECRRDLYNVTIDAYGRHLRPDYDGGLLICYDQTQCKVREDFQGVRRSLYLKYTVKWVNWDASIIPVKIYILDVTDTERISNVSTGLSSEHDCRVEYGVESCRSNGVADADCVDIKRTGLTMPTGGYVIYGAAHLHSGGISSTLYGQDGHSICSSAAIYGQGKEAGNEAGYIVGMSTCYPKPGSVRIADGEKLTLEANYSSSRKHTGVMALFYLLVADQIPESMNALHTPLQIEESTKLMVFGAVALVAVVVAAALITVRRARDDGYQLV